MTCNLFLRIHICGCWNGVIFTELRRKYAKAFFENLIKVRNGLKAERIAYRAHRFIRVHEKRRGGI